MSPTWIAPAAAAAGGDDDDDDDAEVVAVKMEISFTQNLKT